jgi:predicted Zn-dependent peptidase
VAGAILGMKKGSRLYRALVRDQQVAAEAQAFTYDLAKGSDLLVVDVTARPETTVEQLEEAVHAELDRLNAGRVTPEEVARVVTLIETELVASLQSASERADKLSMFATYFGDPALVNQQAERYRAVTAERVNRYVRERFGRENRASLLYVPRDGDAEPTQSDFAMAEAP